MLPQLVHVLCLFLAVSIPVMALNKTLFSWHPTLMALGFFGLMSEGVLTALQFRGTEGTKRTNKVSQHMYWQLSSVLLVTGGFAVIEINKILNNKHHFKTLHAKLGFATSVLVFAVAAGGLVSFRKLGMLHHFPDRWQAVIKTSHRYSGLVIWLLGLLTAELMLSHHTINQVAALPWIWRLAVPVLAALLLYMTFSPPTSPALNSFKSLDHEVVELQLESPSPTRRHRPQDSVSSNA